MNTLILLNGPSSAGKSSLSRALQKQLHNRYLHFEMDAFWNMIPKSEQYVQNFPNLKFAIIDSIINFLKHGHNLIADTVFFNDSLEYLDKHIEGLAQINIHRILVIASQETLQKREMNRKDRTIGLSLSQYDRIQSYSNYETVVNTDDMTTDQAATYLIKSVLNH